MVTAGRETIAMGKIWNLVQTEIIYSSAVFQTWQFQNTWTSNPRIAHQFPNQHAGCRILGTELHRPSSCLKVAKHCLYRKILNVKIQDGTSEIMDIYLFFLKKSVTDIVDSVSFCSIIFYVFFWNCNSLDQSNSME